MNYGWRSSVGSTISTAFSKPPQVPQAPQGPHVAQAPQAVNPPGQAAGRVAPGSALLQVNAADAQNEFEVISVFLSLSLLFFFFLVVALLWAHVIGRVRIYFAYKFQFSMGVLRLFASLFQKRSCISSSWHSFPRDRIVSCPPGGFLKTIYLWGNVLFPFVLSLLLGLMLFYSLPCPLSLAVSFSNVCDRGKCFLIEYV